MSRPLWLARGRDIVHRRPRGVVGIISTWNYPIFLSAVPILHALVAGNGVLWKPSELAPNAAAALAEVFHAAGFPTGLLEVLPATRAAGPEAIEADIDLVHFTGSSFVGQKIATRLGARQIPCLLELGGADAAFVLPGADVRLAARSVWYSATTHGGQTCMATRIVCVARAQYAEFAAELRRLAQASRRQPVVSPQRAE
jgi:acyl-CoA reductase-like NAD-dependent aldehyde dehydrogenase